jgi:hypothetical protein
MRCNRATVGGWEQFTVVDAGGGKIALRSQNKYVSSENGTQAITCSRATIGDWEKFDWVPTADGKVTFRGNNGRFISSENGTQAMTCTRATASGWEAFSYGTGTGRLATNSHEEPADDAASVVVFPNPSKGDITIRVAKPSRVDVIEVHKGFSVFGQRVEESTEVRNLRPGFYAVIVNDGERSKVRKLVIQQ